MKNPFKTKESIESHTGKISIGEVAPPIGSVCIDTTKISNFKMNKFREVSTDGEYYRSSKEYCRLSLDMMFILINLTAKTQRLFFYIAKNLDYGYNYIKLNLSEVKNAINVATDMQVYSAIKELKDFDIIKPIAGNDNLYSVNHNEVFKGDYSNFIDKLRNTYNLNDEHDSPIKYDIVTENNYVGRVKRYYLEDKRIKEANKIAKKQEQYEDETEIKSMNEYKFNFGKKK